MRRGVFAPRQYWADFNISCQRILLCIINSSNRSLAWQTFSGILISLLIITTIFPQICWPMHLIFPDVPNKATGTWTSMHVGYSNPNYLLQVRPWTSQILRNNSLNCTFPAVPQFRNIILTAPISPAHSERCFSTFKHIETFSRNRMVQDRLNTSAVL